MSAGSDGRLIWCIAIGQTIGWGTLFSVFPLFGAPLEAEFGFEVTTFVRTPAQLRAALALEPFEVAEGDTYFVTFLKRPLPAATTTELEALPNEFDTAVVDGTEVHWRMHGKSTDTRIPSRDWARVAGKLSTTSRNVTMLRKVVGKIG